MNLVSRALAGARYRACVRARDRYLDRDPARDLDPARFLANILVDDLAGALASEDWDIYFTHASARAGAIADALASDPALVRARARANELASALGGRRSMASRDLASARENWYLAQALASDLDRTAADRRQPEAWRLVPSAGRLLACAARLLPAADRARYAEEYRAELWEIAHAGQSRRRQLLYAARQLMSALRLHAELRTPRRRKAPL